MAAEGNKSKHFAAKEVLYHQNDRVDKVFVILKGIVALLNHLPNGRTRIIRLHNHNHWLGLEGSLGQRYEHTAVALGDVDVAYISLKKLRLLEQDNPRHYCQILKQGYKNLAQADRWIAEFSTGGIKSRLARLVEFLAKLEFGESSNRVALLTVHEMADMLGVTPESVSRILAEFKRTHTLHRLKNHPADVYEIDSQRLRQDALR